MNDFTREELESLESTIKNMRIYTEIDNYDEDLMIKIQYLIDNYCEHECAHEFKRELMQIDLCDKCKNFKFVFEGFKDE